MNESGVGELFMTPNLQLDFFFPNNQILINHYSVIFWYMKSALHIKETK